MTQKYAVLSTVLLFAGVVHSLQAQTFKVGDYVETNNLTEGKWEPCRVSRPMVRNQYRLDCGDLSPDGSRIAYTTVRRVEELWSLDNVLSAIK